MFVMFCIFGLDQIEKVDTRWAFHVTKSIQFDPKATCLQEESGPSMVEKIPSTDVHKHFFATDEHVFCGSLVSLQIFDKFNDL